LTYFQTTIFLSFGINPNRFYHEIDLVQELTGAVVNLDEEEEGYDGMKMMMMKWENR